MSETIATGFSLVQVTTKNTAPRYPYGKAECHDNENHEKHGAISAVLPDGTSYAWNLASFDCDRYDRGCLISIHHAIQQAHYIKQKSNKITITTDFKLAPKQATNAKQWVEGLNLDEEVDDAYQALREIINQSQITVEIMRVNQAENGKAREIASTQNRAQKSARRFYSINFDVTFFTDAKLYQPIDEDTHQDKHISISQMMARV